MYIGKQNILWSLALLWNAIIVVKIENQTPLQNSISNDRFHAEMEENRNFSLKSGGMASLSVIMLISSFQNFLLNMMKSY